MEERVKTRTHSGAGEVDLFLEGRSHPTTTMTTTTTTSRVVFKLIKKLSRRMKNPTTYKTSPRERAHLTPFDATPIAIALAVALVLRAKKKKKREENNKVDTLSVYFYLFRQWVRLFFHLFRLLVSWLDIEIFSQRI